MNILKEEGFIETFEIDKFTVGSVIVILKYKGPKQIPYISGLTRISRPGFRVYVSNKKIPRVFGGLGIAVCTIRFNFLLKRVYIYRHYILFWYYIIVIYQKVFLF